MFQRSALLAVTTALLLTVTALETSAGERTRRHHGHRFDHHGIHRVVFKPRINVRQRVVVNVPSRWRRHNPVRNFDTYSGAVEVDYRPGVGTWSYGTVSHIEPNAGDRTPTVKIIDIGNGRNDCSMEHGVCVIRN